MLNKIIQCRELKTSNSTRPMAEHVYSESVWQNTFILNLYLEYLMCIYVKNISYSWTTMNTT